MTATNITYMLENKALQCRILTLGTYFGTYMGYFKANENSDSKNCITSRSRYRS